MNKVVDHISGKTNTKVGIDRLFVTFSGNIFLEGLYLEDKKGDTLVYSKELEANLPISPIVFGNVVDLKSLKWEGLKANISREEDTAKFNFDFLLEAFSAQDPEKAPHEKEPLGFNIGSVSIVDFEIDYSDGYLGIESRLRLGKLLLDVDEMNLENRHFGVDGVALYDTDIFYKQTKPFPIKEETTETQLPYLSVGNFKLENVKTTYNSVQDELLVNVNIGNFLLELPKADLVKNDFGIGQLVLKNSDIAIKINGQKTIDTVKVTAKESAFEWPDYVVRAAQIELERNTIMFQSGKQEAVDGAFNPSAVTLSNIRLKANDLEYGNKKANLKLEAFTFNEKSGFHLRDLAFDAKLDNTSAAISGLKLHTNRSAVFGSLALQFPSVQQLIDTPDKTTVKLAIPDLNLDLRDVFIVQPGLVKNEYIKKVALKPFMGTLVVAGTLDAIQISDMQIDWGENTSLLAQGHLYDVTQTDSFSFDLTKIKATSCRRDVLHFISEEDLGISVSKTIVVEAVASGSPENIKGNVVFKIPEGTAIVNGNYRNESQIEFSGNLIINSLRLDKLLKNEQLGEISLTMEAAGSGNSMNTLNASLDTDFSQLEFKGYDFSNLNLTGRIVDGKGDIDFDFKDENLNLLANTKVNLDTVTSNVQLNLNILGADLLALGITRESIKVSTKISAALIGNPRDFELNTSIDEGVVVYDNEQYQMDGIELAIRIDTNNTYVAINSDFLNGSLKSNGSPEQIKSAVQKQFKSYFSDVIEIDSISNPIELKMDAHMKTTPILTKVFLKRVERLDTISLIANFDASTKKLNAALHIPSATYKGRAIDSLNVLVTGDTTDLDITAGLLGFSSDPIAIKKTFFKGNLKNKKLLLDFTSFDDTEKLVHIASEMTLAKDTINLRINPSELIFNKKQWSVPEDNEITISEKLLRFKNVSLTRNAQELTISNTISGIDKEHGGVIFDNFELQTFLSLLNPDEVLVSGLVDGNLIVENPFGATGIVADFIINELEVLQNSMGNLTLKTESTGLSQYDINLSLKDGGLDMDLAGDYVAAETGTQLNLDLDLNKLEMKVIEELSDGAITDSEGNISGNMKVTGTTENLEYDGRLAFIGTNFRVADLNAAFKISDETLKVDNSGLYLDNFQIKDANDHSFTLDGAIYTKTLKIPAFDLAFKAERFQVINSTREDNELFYGKASMDADITVKGDLRVPIIEGKLKMGKITDITYVVPETQLDVEEMEDVVIFVDRENSNAILTRYDQEETPSLFRGINANTILEIADDAVFHIIIDERTGDNLQISGDAALNLIIEPNGRINLTGRYELNSGHYETNLYNIVKRRFEINPGSTISLLGNPRDAKFDMTAVYSVRTSAAPLMTAVTSGQDASVTNKYKQILPFLVYLNVDGGLLEPKLSFGLDMPENARGSLGGAVYERVLQLNEQESELNKQVFSLLALNRFFPDSGSDGSIGGTTALAQDNVNKVLSGELNTFSDKVFGNSGFDLDFDLDSFTDYQGDSPEDRTKLNINAKKNFFNDRLIITAGSAVDVKGSSQVDQGKTPIIGNVSLEYLLSENGRYRLKGFSREEYQNVVDGQIILTGVALIFNREFNRFSELFNPLKNEEKEKKEAKDDDRDKDSKMENNE